MKEFPLQGGEGQPAYSYSSASARNSRRVSDIKQLQTALELYFSDASGYPAQGTKAQPVTTGSSGFTTLKSSSGTVYMGSVPANPQPGGEPYRYRSIDDKGNDCTTGVCASYELTFSLEGKIGSLSAGAHVASPNGIP